jgi:hypothetical protein
MKKSLHRKNARVAPFLHENESEISSFPAFGAEARDESSGCSGYQQISS